MRLWMLWLLPLVASEVRSQSRNRNEGRSQGRETRPLIRPRQEVVNTTAEPTANVPEGTNFLTLHTTRHSQLAAAALENSVDGDIVRNYGGGGIGGAGSGGPRMNADIARRQMDTTILLLQRLSDRLSAIETLQGQRAERIDTINYRLTRLELLAEEQKSSINEMSGAIRHRMDTADNEFDRVAGLLEDLKTGISEISLQNSGLKTVVDGLTTRQGGESTKSGPKLQAVMATLYGMRQAAQTLQNEVAVIGQNLSSLANISGHLDHLNQEMVTKQYLHQSLIDLKSQKSSAPIPRMTMNPRFRQGTSGQEPEDCWQLMQKGKTQSGVYRIQPRYSSLPFFVYCDMDTDGGGWTVIQRREDGSVDFLREWADYKHGFGNLAGEFWLGNEKIHLLTNQYVSKLRVDLSDFDQQDARAKYAAFAIGSEEEGYSLKMLGKYTGDAGDSLQYHVGRRFSTIDVDNDAWPENNCARDHQGAWWYRACETSNLNGRYLHGPVPADHEYTGLYWYDFRGPRYSLWRSRMMIRRGGRVGNPIFKDFAQVNNTRGTTRRPPQEDPQTPPPTTQQPTSDNFNPDHDPYAKYEYPYDPYG